MKYSIKRIIQLIPILIAITFLSFAMMRLAGSDVVEQNVIKAILQNQINTGDIKNCYLFCGPAGTGKAQPLDSLVLTDTGYIQMSSVKVGTKVFTRKGANI